MSINITSNNILILSIFFLVIGHYFNINFMVLISLSLGWLLVSVNTFLIILSVKNDSKKFFKFSLSSIKERLVDFPYLIIFFAILANLWCGWSYLSVLLVTQGFILGAFEFYLFCKK